MTIEAKWLVFLKLSFNCLRVFTNLSANFFVRFQFRFAQTGRGGGRERFRGRFEDKTHSTSGGRSNAPPSRHLWVGNLSHSIEEADLTDQFLRYGELESVAFQPGRSYAFINFKIEEDAIASMKALQGFPLAGNPLRIEFAKAVSLDYLLIFLLLVLKHVFFSELTLILHKIYIEEIKITNCH